MRMSFTLHWSFSFPAFDTFHLFSKIPPISLGTPLSHACRLRCYIPWNFSDNSRSLVISFKIPATQILIRFSSFRFYLQNSSFHARRRYKNTHLLTTHFSCFLLATFSFTLPQYSTSNYLTFLAKHSTRNSWYDLEPTSSRVFTICFWSSEGSKLPLLRHRASFLLEERYLINFQIFSTEPWNMRRARNSFSTPVRLSSKLSNKTRLLESWLPKPL